jgi:hypothetical protein
MTSIFFGISGRLRAPVEVITLSSSIFNTLSGRGVGTEPVAMMAFLNEMTSFLPSLPVTESVFGDSKAPQP